MREVLRVSGGADANEVNAHWVNLEGLSATTICLPQITHAVVDNVYVPRAIFVDHPRCQRESSSSVEPLDPYQEIWDQANSLALSVYSRYRAPVTATSNYATTNGRHVNWDELDGIEEEEEEDPQERERRERQRRMEWEKSKSSTEDAWDRFWNTDVNGSLVEPSKSPEEVDPTTKQEERPQQKAPAPTNNEKSSKRTWQRYLMPPLHPHTCLETTRTSFDFDMNQQNTLSEQLEERIRHMLEDCDSCQGITFSYSDDFGTQFSKLLNYWADECPNKRSIVFQVNQTIDHPKREERVRRSISNLMATSMLTEQADLVVPLLVKDPHAALVAACLEATYLPFRVNSDSASIGLQSFNYVGSFDDASPFGTTNRLSFAEFVKFHQRPSGSRNMLELDVAYPTVSLDLDATLISNTSVERDLRMRDPRMKRTSDGTLPGQWMMNPENGGILSQASFSLPVSQTDRSLHHHFAVSTALRLTGANTKSLPQYVDCLLEGSGVRFRPMQSVATATTQSLEQLTAGGYGAGSYWRSLFQQPSLWTTPVVSVLGNSTRVYRHLYETSGFVRSMLAPRNKRSISRAMFHRDVLAGLLPETDDVESALATLLDLRDSYEPPNGSGLIVDEGEYVDIE